MPNTIEISDAADPRISAYVSIRERDLHGAHGGRFIVEGKLALGTLLSRSRFEIESLFLCETRLKPLADLIARVPDTVPIYVAPQTVMDAIAGFPMHRGVLACGRKGAPLSADALIAKARAAPATTLLILSELSNHDNVGAAFRNAAAFGASGVLLDAMSCDPLYRKAIRVSSGAGLWLPFAHAGDTAGQINAAHAAGFDIWTLTPNISATSLYQMPVPSHLALVLGPEGPGLSDALIQAGHPVRIPMTDEFDSVNVATAAAIALAHVFNARTP